MRLKSLMPFGQFGFDLKEWNKGADHVILRAKERFGVTLTRKDVGRLVLDFELYQDWRSSVYLTTLPDGRSAALFVSPRGRPSTIMSVDWAMGGRHDLHDKSANIRG